MSSWISVSEHRVANQQPKCLAQRLLLRVDAPPPAPYRDGIDFNHVSTRGLRAQKPHQAVRAKALPVRVRVIRPQGEELTA